ncbi:MAG TPA: exonuclease domain-containing protein, partial [Acidimicrobiia bacterium]|nr:exonuclease domain-containing protein [Acidimicrobiia bacterium]
VLTGITESMVIPAPRVREVLPAFLEFLGGAVIVGHNVRFDVSFLDAALRDHGYPTLTNRRVDTLAIARRLVRDEVPNLKLATLANHLRASTQPVHRAYSDAAATAEVFHTLLERAATFGVLGLDDLLALPTLRNHPSAAKLSGTARLPREPGVYLFRDRAGRVLYVGKATNLRSRVRSYFADDRRKIPQMLRETESVDHFVCRDPLEAAVREVRLIHELQPRFNRASKAWQHYTYLKLTEERFPRLAVTRTARADGAHYLGPFRSTRAAHLVREAIESASPIRRCPLRIGRRAAPTPGAPCVPAQLGVATCPCRAQVDDDEYAAIADVVRRGITGEPHLLLDPLVARMRRLAADERFEEAASTRDRLNALGRALHRRTSLDSLRAVERLVVHAPDGPVELRHGRMVLAGGPGAAPAGEPVPLDLPPGRHELDELLVVERWLGESARHLRIDVATGTFASATPRVPVYEPVRARARRR